MRLPRLALPRLRLPLDWLDALGGRRTVLYVAYTTVLFVTFLVLTFPFDLLVRRALSSLNHGPVTVEFNNGNLSFRGYDLSGLRIVSEGTDGRAPYLECSHLWIRPLFTELVRGNLYAARAAADLYGGAALGDIRLAGGNVVGSLQWQDLDVGRYRTLTALLDEGQLAGRLSGQFSFEARGTNLNAAQGSGEVTIDGIGLSAAKVAGFTVPDLHFRQTKLKFTLHAGRVEVQDLTAAGDVNVQGGGQVVLRAPLQDSILNLRGTVLPTPTTPDALRAILALIPRAPGSKPDAPVTVTGTLARPRLR